MAIKTLVDKAKTVRDGESLDSEKLSGFLEKTFGPSKKSLEVKQFPSGYSNLTYLIDWADKEFVLRRPPFVTKAKTAHDMGREFKVLNGLSTCFPFSPKVLAFCEDLGVLDCNFYLMEKLEGIILRKNFPPDLDFNPQKTRSLCENLVKVQARLHNLDYVSAGLDELGKPDGYVSRQIYGWSKRYLAAKTPDATGFEKVMEWLANNIPEEKGSALIHNDYKLDNVVLNPDKPTEIIGVLDWEMATLGDPLMDLGSSLAYWVQSDDPDFLQMIRLMPTSEAGALTRKEIVDLYFQESSLKPEDFSFYYCYGLFRLAGIVQQIYYRYYHGQTKDERFKGFVHIGKSLELAALKTIKEGFF